MKFNIFIEKNYKLKFTFVCYTYCPKNSVYWSFILLLSIYTFTQGFNWFKQRKHSGKTNEWKLAFTFHLKPNFHQKYHKRLFLVLFITNIITKFLRVSEWIECRLSCLQLISACTRSVISTHYHTVQWIAVVTKERHLCPALQFSISIVILWK